MIGIHEQLDGQVTLANATQTLVLHNATVAQLYGLIRDVGLGHYVDERLVAPRYDTFVYYPRGRALTTALDVLTVQKEFNTHYQVQQILKVEDVRADPVEVRVMVNMPQVGWTKKTLKWPRVELESALRAACVAIRLRNSLG